jgi:hypothetical protein
MITRRATRASLFVWMVTLAGGPVAFGQHDPSRAALERDQQSADFALRLRQSQQAVELQRLRPDDVQLRQEMEALHLQQQQRLDSLNDAQRLELQLRESGAAGALPPIPSGSLARERATVRDQSERELSEQLRRAERANVPKDPPRWGPTLRLE